LTVLLVVGLIHWGPEIAELLMGDGRVEWISKQLSETLRKKSELVVFEAEINAQETIQQDAWIIGTVQKVLIPYTFSVRYTVDLSSVQIRAESNRLIVSLPPPQAKYQQLLVDEDHVKKQDWLYPLTAERYAEMKTDLEERLLAKYSSYDEYIDEAWEHAIAQIEDLFQSFAQQNPGANDMLIQIEQITSE